MDTRRAPTVFWGRHGGQGRHPDSRRTKALILMGDWCGPVPTPQERKPARDRRGNAKSAGNEKYVAPTARTDLFALLTGAG